jgi:inosine/xanthosine triphosphatase
MEIIVIASKNPVKIQATLNGFRRMFPGEVFEVKSLSVESGVAEQPLSDEETLQGAINRANNAQDAFPDADYWVGIEGGVSEIQAQLAAFAWIVVKSRELVGKGRTGTFFLSGAVKELIRAGKELGAADDIVFNRNNSKQENGAVGLLTGDVIDRTDLYEHAAILALIPFKNEKYFPARSF